jgi:hypothetical protein
MAYRRVVHHRLRHLEALPQGRLRRQVAVPAHASDVRRSADRVGTALGLGRTSGGLSNLQDEGSWSWR